MAIHEEGVSTHFAGATASVLGSVSEEQAIQSEPTHQRERRERHPEPTEHTERAL
jgi:hypothetical protein